MLPELPPVRLKPLLNLAEQHPPRISYLTAALVNRQDLTNFISLVKSSLPEQADQILSHGSIDRQISEFASTFSQRVFPLSTDYIEICQDEGTDIGDASQLSILLQGIPYELMGYELEYYHNLWNDQWEDAFAHVALITDLSCIFGYDYTGLRTVWTEAASQFLSQTTLDKLPQDPVKPEHLLSALQGTPMEPVGLIAAWLSGQTNIFFLDYHNDWDETPEFDDPWEPEIIANAKEEWENALHFIERIKPFMSWFDLDPDNHFNQLLAFTLDRLQHLPEYFLSGT